MRHLLVLLAILYCLSEAAPPTKPVTILPKCSIGQSCTVSLCGCCGKCDADTDYICQKGATDDCASPTIPSETNKKLTPEEHREAVEFFKQVAKHSKYKGWDWEKANAPLNATN